MPDIDTGVRPWGHLGPGGVNRNMLMTRFIQRWCRPVT